jgi:multiple sugar transport system ATP-binding protein
MAGLILKDLSKSYGEKKVLENLSLEVKDREFCILLGPSGCGKSTILRLIAGLDAPNSGAILIGNKEVSRLTPKERDIAMVFQSYALYPHMDVFENMSFSLKMRKTPMKEIKKKVRDAARMLDIADLLNRKPRELSGGQRQRVAIGRAIVRDPELFLFDEPLSNLDAKLRSAMRIEIKGIHEKLKKTIIYVTHDQIEALTLGEKIVLIDQGKIQQIGTPSEVYDRPANIFVASFIGSPRMNLLKGKIQMSDNRLRFLSDTFSFDMKMNERLAVFEGEEIILGVRPESLIIGEGYIHGKVEFVEHLGAEKIVYIKAGNEKLIARAPAEKNFIVSDKINLSFQESNIHLFHEERRIGL